jgi:UDP-2,3-diacylglucosamine hydrolase
MSTLFISDLHLDESAPQRTAAFVRCLDRDAERADAVYVLGDLFEAWIGDDDDTELATQVQVALRRIADRGVPLYFIAGNRDFLIGAAFAECCGLTILTDPTIHEIGGEATLLMHGDTLCTDDTDYLVLREQFHSTTWQEDFLSQSLERRREFARSARAESSAATADMPAEIMDVNEEAVRETMATHGVRRLIHGHTHRPATHTLTVAGAPARRIVLGAWHDQAWRLWVDPDGGERLEAFEL